LPVGNQASKRLLTRMDVQTERGWLPIFSL